MRLMVYIESTSGLEAELQAKLAQELTRTGLDLRLQHRASQIDKSAKSMSLS